MADRHDMTIGIGLKADLEGGVQTEKQLEKVRQKARELGKDANDAGNQTSQAFGKMQSAVGKFRAALSGLGVAGLLAGLLASIRNITESFGTAEKEAEKFAESVKAAEHAKEIDALAESYGRLTKAIRDSASANDHQNAMISKAVAAERELEDAVAQAAEQRELAAVDPSAPDAAEQRQAISARYAAAAGRRAAVRGKEDIVFRRQDLNSQAAQLDRAAAGKSASAEEDSAAIAGLEKRRRDALARSTSENRLDARDNISRIANNAKMIATLQWGRVGDDRTDAGNAEREKAQQEADALQAEIDRLKKSRDEKLESAKSDQEAARRKREEADIEAGRLKSAEIRMGTSDVAGSSSVGRADAALASRQARIASDEAIISGAASRRAGIQSRIDAQNAILSSSADRANKEDRDVYLAQRRLDQGDAENRGKGWHRYVQGARKDLEADVRREEDEAAEARAEFGRTKNAVAETLKKLNEEMRKFEADLKAAQSRMKVNSDGGASQ